MFIIFFIILPNIFCEEFNGYDYLNHGADWTGTCNQGVKQSPIDVTVSPVKNSTKPSYFLPQYSPTSAFVNHFNTSLLIEGEFGNLFTTSADIFAKSQSLAANEIRFRAPAEHTFQGHRFPLEVQIHHQVKNPINY
jgi:carbonic anhydrase